MKKIILSITLLLFAISGYCQHIKPVEMDSLVSVTFPVASTVKDTLGQQIFSANGMYGTMIAIREANGKNNTPLKKANDLNKVLKDYIKNIQGQLPGSSAENVRDTTIGDLKAKLFTLKSDDQAGNTQLINFALIYTQDATYTFEYIYPEMRKDLVGDEYKTFISSISLSPDLQRNDQYLSEATGMSPVSKISIFGGAVVIAVLVVLVVKKKKETAIG